jgi:hypothetical protein
MAGCFMAGSQVVASSEQAARAFRLLALLRITLPTMVKAAKDHTEPHANASTTFQGQGHGYMSSRTCRRVRALRRTPILQILREGNARVPLP